MNKLWKTIRQSLKKISWNKIINILDYVKLSVLWALELALIISAFILTGSASHQALFGQALAAFIHAAIAMILIACLLLIGKITSPRGPTGGG